MHSGPPTVRHAQIDTISVMDRAHHHVLKTRVPNYSEQMLDHLVRRDRTVFGYWSHAAAYLPAKANGCAVVEGAQSGWGSTGETRTRYTV